MLKKIFQNARRPSKSIGGTLFLNMMNKAHYKGAMWGLSQINIKDCNRVLDIGCGGGMNIKNLLELAPEAIVCGIDYSTASVRKSRKLNQTDISNGRVEIKEASVESIPFTSNHFNLVTAFETVYFWPDIEENFKEIARVLKKDGKFLVCNEIQRPEGNEKWLKLIDMKIMTGNEIKKAMEKAGFNQVKVVKHQNGKWLCVVGYKAADF